MITLFKKILKRFSFFTSGLHGRAYFSFPSVFAFSKQTGGSVSGGKATMDKSALSSTPYTLKKGQAMTEVMLLFPLFMLIFFISVKIFALLVLVQKMEIASYYAARRWQLESHLNANYANDFDINQLKPHIEKKVKAYIGFGSSAEGFLDLRDFELEIERTQVWNIVTLKVMTNAASGLGLLCKSDKQTVCADYGQACLDGYDYICTGGRTLEVIKYVPNRDRPIQFVLPGLQ